MNPYNSLLPYFSCSTLKELYIKLEINAFEKRGIKELPFTLTDLENSEKLCTTITNFIIECHKDNRSNEDAKQLIISLKINPPKESYKNPNLPNGKCTTDEINLMVHIFHYGIDLPGSRHNLTGNMQYYTEFFIDMFFGNYTEFMEHVESKSSKKLKTALNRREGYCQYSPIFAPILGLKMVNIEDHKYFTCHERQEIRKLFNGNNENKHTDILAKLLLLGADPNAHDIFGYTPLHYATSALHDDIIAKLLAFDADPNQENRHGERPLTLLRNPKEQEEFKCVEILLDFGAKLKDKDSIQELRSSVESNGSLELAGKVRAALPRDDQECERCGGFAEETCCVCGLVYYCSVKCRELDWKFHKQLEKKNGLSWKQKLYFIVFFLVLIYVAWNLFWLCYKLIFEYQKCVVFGFLIFIICYNTIYFYHNGMVIFDDPSN